MATRTCLLHYTAIDLQLRLSFDRFIRTNRRYHSGEREREREKEREGNGLSQEVRQQGRLLEGCTLSWLVFFSKLYTCIWDVPMLDMGVKLNGNHLASHKIECLHALF